VNGRKRTLQADPCARLLDVLRDRLGLMGAKEGCGLGECGACSVLMNGRPVNACLVLTGSAQGAEIVTVEGLQAGDGRLHPVQNALVEAGAVQCGFCTPGIAVTASKLVDGQEHAGEDEIRTRLAGNLCRCTGYVKVVQGGQRACELKKAGGSGRGNGKGS